MSVHPQPQQYDRKSIPPFFWRSPQDSAPLPRLNIVIMVIGSRGDIQPFVEIGRILRFQYGHRVRIATHPDFRKVVADDCGLEHFSVGGDPAQLMAFMVKNPGMLPKLQTLRSGEIGRRRAEMRGMFERFWKACVEPGPNGGNASVPFLADAIIANPPCLVHAHCAERLGCHLHIMFTFPYTPTKAFPHPLAATNTTTTDPRRRNLLSYTMVDALTWQGLGDLVNRFRREDLGLEEVSTIYAASHVGRIAFPWTYLWSPGLVPKPLDWGDNIRVVGFPFLDLATTFKPEQALVDFLADGDPPIYIGFGSIVMDDAEAFLDMIVEAVQMVGIRAVISRGWAGFGARSDLPGTITFIQDVPHDWLFPRCCAVVHHGGAGTTAIGLKCGLPTVIVPFFGDQAFWGSVVSSAKAGAHQSIQRKNLTTQLLAEAMRQCLTLEARGNARRIADAIATDGSGAANAVRHFHDCLMLEGRKSWRCDLFKDRIAVWECESRGKLRLSAVAAEVMMQEGKLRHQDLRLFRQREWNEIQGRNDPLSGGLSAIYDLFHHSLHELARGPMSLRRVLQKPIGRFHTQSEVDLEANPIEACQSSSEIVHSGADAQRRGTYSSHMILLELGSGLFSSILLILQFPAFFLANVADGFHNLPQVYGDTTVRPQLRITGLKSGFRAGMRELVLGLLDALIGLIVLSAHDIKTHGAFGIATGLLKGLGGLVCKPCAALFGFLGYTLKGLVYQLCRSSNSSDIRMQTIELGRSELENLTTAEKHGARDSAARMRKRWYRSTWKLLPYQDPRREHHERT